MPFEENDISVVLRPSVTSKEDGDMLLGMGQPVLTPGGTRLIPKDGGTLASDLEAFSFFFKVVNIY